MRLIDEIKKEFDKFTEKLVELKIFFENTHSFTWEYLDFRRNDGFEEDVKKEKELINKFLPNQFVEPIGDFSRHAH